MVVGTYTVTLDQQGRVVIPTDWFEEFGENVVVTRSLSSGKKHYLTVLPKDMMSKYVSEFLGSGVSDVEQIELTRRFLDGAFPAKIDVKKRRITIHPDNVAYAGLTSSVTMTGNLQGGISVFEIWDPETYRETRMSDDEFSFALKACAEEKKRLR